MISVFVLNDIPLNLKVTESVFLFYLTLFENLSTIIYKETY